MATPERKQVLISPSHSERVTLVPDNQIIACNSRPTVAWQDYARGDYDG